jgi:ATP/ADP translocase/HEAT repeat protein/CRP-like cAMP-binding protein
MDRSISSRILGRLGQIQAGEAVTAFLMLAYSFLAMASYNIIKPITRSKFIKDVGAEDIPYMVIAAAALIGIIMLGYSWLVAHLPRRWSLPIVQLGIVGLLATFGLLFRTDAKVVSVLFYLAGLILGILLISQFWTLANLVYDPRQAKRLFGFIGAGSSLGGFVGSMVTRQYVKQIGSNNVILISAAIMILCVLIVITIIVRERLTDLSGTVEGEQGIGWRQALALLRKSEHLQLIALVITFAALGANIIEQQLLLAAQATKGQESAIASFLAEIQAWTSGIGFLIQILLTSRIHSFFGIGFALLILPVSLGSTGLIMLFNAALWAPSLARVMDQSLRYTVDKTTREILFMPLPTDIKLQAKPFVDVTVDRFGKGLAGVILLVLIRPWGLNLNWQQISYASLAITAIWVFMAIRARRGYREAFRRSLEGQAIKPAELRLSVPDLSMLEALVAELSSPDERRVLYAMDILESFDKKSLVTPLLLLHQSPAVRLQALSVVDGASAQTASRWLPSVRRLLTDPDPEVRAAAVGALANIQAVDVVELVRPGLVDPNPRIAMTAAMVLARRGAPEDVAAAERILQALRADPRDSAVEVRKELAAVLRHIPDPRFRQLLIPLLTDSSLEVAREALRSVRQLGDSDALFLPALISLLRHPQLKQSARELLVGCGEAALDVLGHFLHDQGEDPAARRHIPSTIARIPSPRAADLLIEALGESDGRLRFEVIAGLEAMRRRQPDLNFRREPLEARIISECAISSGYAALLQNCFTDGMPERGRLLARALWEKDARSMDRIYRLLSLIFPWRDIHAARWSIERGGPARARALEYLDNLLPGTLRRRALPILERSRPRMMTLSGNAASQPGEALQVSSLRALIHDPDPAISAAAVHFVWETNQRQYENDLETLVASPNGGDWWVFEAASWTLGAFRSNADRSSELWVEPLPAVEIAARLGRLPLFASVSADELFRIAGSGRQVRHKPDISIYGEGIVPGDVQFLMQGRVVRGGAMDIQQYVDAPAPLSFQEVLEGRPMAEAVRAVTACICISLTLAEMQILMAESAGLVEGLLRMLCTSMPNEISDLVVRRADLQALVEGAGIPDPIGRATLLEALPVISQISREEVLALAAIASEEKAVSGAQIFSETDPPALHLLVSGSVTLESTEDEAEVSAGPGDAVGLYQMLAGLPLVRRARCIEDASFLRVEREDFLDLLMQRPELQRQLLGALFRGSHLPA